MQDVIEALMDGMQCSRKTAEEAVAAMQKMYPDTDAIGIQEEAANYIAELRDDPDA